MQSMNLFWNYRQIRWKYITTTSNWSDSIFPSINLHKVTMSDKQRINHWCKILFVCFFFCKYRVMDNQSFRIGHVYTTFAAKNIIIHSKRNKFTFDFNRMSLNESKHILTARRLWWRFLLKYNCDNACVVLIRFRLYLKIMLRGYPEKAKRVSHEIQTEPVLRGRQVPDAGPVFRSWNPCVVSRWPRT